VYFRKGPFNLSMSIMDNEEDTRLNYFLTCRHLNLHVYLLVTKRGFDLMK
jgi:hypothetical protein